MLDGKGFDERWRRRNVGQRVRADARGVRAEIAIAGETTHFRWGTMSSDSISRLAFLPFGQVTRAATEP